jgi:pimeloyl-ACP methyl ester carboxylesterase
MAEIETNGVRTHVEETGSGTPLVLIHGLGGSTDLWKHVVGPLSREFRVVAYDLRGGGRTPATGPTTLAGLADDLDAVVEGLGLGSVLLMGHSMGGTLALAYAAAHPEKVRAIVALGAPTGFPDAGREAMRTRAETVEAQGMGAVAETVATNGTAPAFRERDPEGFGAFVALLESNDPTGYAALCRVVSEIDVVSELGRVSAPVLLVAGDLDAVASPEANEANVGRLPNARYVSVGGCAHILPLENPQAVLDAALPFLREAAA